MKPSPKVPPDEWARAHRVYPETAGVPGPREPSLTPYAIPFGRALHDGDYLKNVFVTAAQSGKTDTELDAIGARLDQKPAPVLFVGPTKDFITDQFEPRVMDLLDEADTLKNKVVRGRAMKKTLKWIAGVKLRLAYGGSSSQLKSDPAALAIIDEYDEMLANVRGQGDVLGLVDARGGTYSDFTMGISSTPALGYVETEIDPMSGLEFWKPGTSDEIESPIWRLWQEGTRYHWAWPCPHCREYFIPRFSLLKWADGTEDGMKNATPAQAMRTVHINCPHCGVEITDAEDKLWMNERGSYVAPGQTVKLVKDDPKVKGDPPESDTWSAWASGLASPFVSWGVRIQKYQTAMVSGDDDRIQTAINAQFGELHFPGGGGGRPPWQAVMDRAQPYALGEVPIDVLRLVCGVDVQGASLYYIVRGFGARGSSWLIDYGQIHGLTDDDEVWRMLTNIVTSPFPGGLMIERVLVDSGFRPDKKDAGGEHRVYEYCRDLSWLAKPTKGKDVLHPPYKVSKIEVNRKGEKKKTSLDLVWLSTDFFKQLVYTRINMPVAQVGGLFVPHDVTEDYARQVTSEARTIGDNGKAVWVPLTRDNHYLDCEALCAAAAYSLNVQHIPEGTVRDVEESDGSDPSDHVPPRSTETKDEPHEEAPSEPPRSASRGNSEGGSTSLRDRWKRRSRTMNT